MLRIIMRNITERNNTVGNLHVLQNPLFAYLHAAGHGPQQISGYPYTPA